MRNDENAPGVPLASYLANDSAADILFICSSCTATTARPIPAVIDWLKSRGLGDERTGVRAIAKLVTWRCKCGARSFETRPGFQLPTHR